MAVYTMRLLNQCQHVKYVNVMIFCGSDTLWAEHCQWFNSTIQDSQGIKRSVQWCPVIRTWSWSILIIRFLSGMFILLLKLSTITIRLWSKLDDWKMDAVTLVVHFGWSAHLFFKKGTETTNQIAAWRWSARIYLDDCLLCPLTLTPIVSLNNGLEG